MHRQISAQGVWKCNQEIVIFHNKHLHCNHQNIHLTVKPAPCFPKTYFPHLKRSKQWPHLGISLIDTFAGHLWTKAGSLWSDQLRRSKIVVWVSLWQLYPLTIPAPTAGVSVQLLTTRPAQVSCLVPGLRWVMVTSTAWTFSFFGGMEQTL